MADIKRTLSQLQALYADNTTADISENDIRDGFKTVVGSMNIVSTSANINADSDDIVFDVDTNAGDVTITIPSANASDGSGDTYEQKVFYFINSGSNNIILSGPSFTVPTNENLAIISNGTTWLKLSKFSETIGSLNNLSDVVITSAQEGESLIYNGSEWINNNPLVYVDIKNGEGSTITRGQPVYVSGSTGGGTPIVSLADNNGTGTNPAIGLVADNSINNGDDGRALINGILENINTSAYSVGDAVYLDNTSGILTNIRPTSASEQVQKVGLVTKVNSISGKILVIGAGRANDVPNELTTLTGVALDATNLGSFTGTTISNNQTIKGAFQDTINSIAGLAKGLDYQGTWNASTNSPALASSVGTEGHYYIVGTAGSTNLNGITDWKIGDWVLWSETGSAWQKVDNTSFETVTNQGSGAGVFKQIVNGTEVQFKSLTDGSKISFTENTNDIQIDDSVIVSEVNANTAKVGITPSQASEITANTAKTGITSGQASAITANTAKNTNVTTNLSEGTVTNTTVDVNSSDGTNATLAEASTSRAGVMSKAKFDEVVANTAKDGITTAQATKLNGIESNADVTDTANVTTAGALMDSEVTNLAQVKAFDSSDYATSSQGTLADNALPKSGGAMTGAITTNSTFDGRDVSVDGTKLDTIESNADVTDATNVAAAGALMDSINTNKLLGRGAAGSGSIEEISLGTNLSFSGTTLNATGGGSASPLTTKGDLYTYDTADARLPLGTNGQALVVDTAEATGLKYVNLSETPAVGGGLLVDLGMASTNQIIANNATDTINFDDTVTSAIDKNGDWDNTNKKFVVSSASGDGTYQFEVNVFASNSTAIYYNLQAFVNGSIKTPNGAFAMSDAVSDSTWDGVAGTVSMDLEVGDEVEIKLKSYGGATTISANGTWNFTQGMRISKTSGIKGDKGDTGTGDVTGPASNTTNAIPVYDGTSGKIIKDSGVTVDASNNVSANNFNGVPLTSGGVATKFLNEAGGYTVPAGGGGGTAAPVYFRTTSTDTGTNYNNTGQILMQWTPTGALSTTGISLASNQFTVTDAGVYDVYASAYYVSTGAQRIQLKLTIWVDGTQVTLAGAGQGGYARAAGSAFNGMSHVSSLLNLTAGQYVEIKTERDGITSGTANLITGQSVFKMHKLQGLKGDTGATGAASAVRTVTTTTTTTLATDADVTDIRTVTALTSVMSIQNPTGTPINGQVLKFRITDSGGSSGTISYGSEFSAFGVALPTTITSGKTLYLGCIYNSTDTTWDVVAAVEKL